MSVGGVKGGCTSIRAVSSFAATTLDWMMYTTTVKCIIDLKLHHITAPRFGLSQRIAAGTGLEFGPKVEGGWRSSCRRADKSFCCCSSPAGAWPSPSPRTSRSRHEEGSGPTIEREPAIPPSNQKGAVIACPDIGRTVTAKSPRGPTPTPRSPQCPSGAPDYC